MIYYNEFDNNAAAWLRELIKDGLIPDGTVDTRDIRDVQPSDLAGYAQCHFFAGIGGWTYALRLAGWPDDLPVWTGSCPCQPFSAAGKRKGTQDERHLWPEFRRLIAECRPPTIFGEQVASKLGRGWLAGVRADLEALGYSVGAADLCSAGVGSPNIRQRLYWVADAELQRTRAGDGQERPSEQRRDRPAIDGDALRLADAECTGVRLQRRGEDCGTSQRMQRENRERERIWIDSRAGSAVECGRLADAAGIRLDGLQEREPGSTEEEWGMLESAGTCIADRLGNANSSGCEQQCRAGTVGQKLGPVERAGHASIWSDYSLILCRDCKTRRIPAGSQSAFLGLADGVPGGVDARRRAGFPLCEAFQGRDKLLKGYGNAINPVLAAEFILAARLARLGRKDG